MRKKVIAVLTGLFMLLSTSTVFAGQVKVIVNGENVEFKDQGAILHKSRTLVPIRDVFEKLGFTVKWNPKTATATLTDQNNEVVIKEGQKNFTVNKEKATSDVAAQIIEGRTLLPLRAICEALGSEVNWDTKTDTAIIEYSGEKVEIGKILPNPPRPVITDEEETEKPSKDDEKTTEDTNKDKDKDTEKDKDKDKPEKPKDDDSVSRDKFYADSETIKNFGDLNQMDASFNTSKKIDIPELKEVEVFGYIYEDTKKDAGTKYIKSLTNENFKDMTSIIKLFVKSDKELNKIYEEALSMLDKLGVDYEYKILVSTNTGELVIVGYTEDMVGVGFTTVKGIF